MPHINIKKTTIYFNINIISECFAFRVIRHEKPSNHIDINLKFVHLVFTACRFSLSEEGGDWGDLYYPKYYLVPACGGSSKFDWGRGAYLIKGGSFDKNVAGYKPASHQKFTKNELLHT